MATESEIEKYRTLLTDSNIEKLKSIKQTYINQISQAKTDLGKASFTDWEDLVSSKFKLHYQNLKTGYSTIETDVGDGSNLDILITLVKGLKTKCEEYHRYQEEYNSIKTGVSFSNKELKANERRKNELSQLMSDCSLTIDETLRNIKRITFNASSEETADISTTFEDEVVTITEQPEEDYSDTDGGKHLSNEDVNKIYQDRKQKYEELLAQLREIDFKSPDAYDQIDALFPEAIDILREYSDALLFMFVKGEMSYDEYMTLSNVDKVMISEDIMDGKVYDVLYWYSSNTNGNDVNAWYYHNNEFRIFAERFKNNACSSQEFLQNVPPLSDLLREGSTLDYNSVEAASQYAIATIVELFENGYTGDVILAKRESENDIFRKFNNKAGDKALWGGFMDSAKEISHRDFDFYHSNGGAFNTN